MYYTKPSMLKASPLCKHTLSAEAKSIKEHCSTHDVSVTFNKENKPVIEYTKKQD